MTHLFYKKNCFCDLHPSNKLHKYVIPGYENLIFIQLNITTRDIIGTYLGVSFT